MKRLQTGVLEQADDNSVVIEVCKDMGINCSEHFRLNIDLSGDYTVQVARVFTLIKDGLYIVNPNFDSTKYPMAYTEEEGYDRFIYVEGAEIDTDKGSVEFWNGDGWVYIVEFKHIVGTLQYVEGLGTKNVIVVTKGQWIEE